jgi:formate hydrogenlyase subunit 3/multisubunit Na+/H+ antiporter MnhD subunit
MFQRVIDDLKDSTGTTVRMTSLAALVGFALFVTLSFLCAAAFIAVMQRYGLIEACLTVAGIFLVISLIAAAVYTTKKRRAKARAMAAAREAARAAASAPMIDPMLIAAALPILRAVGLKKLVPLLAVAGVALGYLASRNSAAADEEAEAETDEE